MPPTHADDPYVATRHPRDPSFSVLGERAGDDTYSAADPPTDAAAEPKPPLAGVREGDHSIGWREVPAGSRPATSQPMTAAASGVPTRISSRLVMGMLVSEESPSSWLLRR